MTKILDIQQRVKKLYEVAREPAIKLPLSLQAVQWVSFAQESAAAATLISQHAPHLWLPRLQLTGQSVELALKACLAASGAEPPVDHDLLKLYGLASKHGVELLDLEQAAIVHLGHFYHRDLATSTRFKARYPTPTTEPLGGAVPDNSTFASLVRSLCEHAKSVNKRSLAKNAPQIDGGTHPPCSNSSSPTRSGLP